MKNSRQTLINVVVFISLFLLLFSALSIAVLYIGTSLQSDPTQNASGTALNDILKNELSGANLIVDTGTGEILSGVVNSGQAVVLPTAN
jgi:hypothetical protein